MSGHESMDAAERELVELAVVSGRLRERAAALSAKSDEMWVGATTPRKVRRELRRVERERARFHRARDRFLRRHGAYVEAQLSPDELRAFMEV